jgi:hypothetical protein
LQDKSSDRPAAAADVTEPTLALVTKLGRSDPLPLTLKVQSQAQEWRESCGNIDWIQWARFGTLVKFSFLSDDAKDVKVAQFHGVIAILQMNSSYHSNSLDRSNQL